jgi:hypothetical protein
VTSGPMPSPGINTIVCFAIRGTIVARRASGRGGAEVVEWLSDGVVE